MVGVGSGLAWIEAGAGVAAAVVVVGVGVGAGVATTGSTGFGVGVGTGSRTTRLVLIWILCAGAGSGFASTGVGVCSATAGAVALGSAGEVAGAGLADFSVVPPCDHFHTNNPAAKTNTMAMSGMNFPAPPDFFGLSTGCKGTPESAPGGGGFFFWFWLARFRASLIKLMRQSFLRVRGWRYPPVDNRSFPAGAQIRPANIYHTPHSLIAARLASNDTRATRRGR